MEQMTLNEKKFIETALLSDLRIDGRGPFDYRNVAIKFGREDGSSEVQLGQTHVMGFVTSQLVKPYRDRPNEGTLSIYTEFSPMADPSFEIGRPGVFAVELGRIVDRGLRESRAVDTESLCVVAGKWVWSVRIDLHILDNGGNLVDAANIAALVALLTFRRPECTLGGDNDQEVIIHSPEVREPLPLIVHHLPVAITFAFIGSESTVVIDPSNFEEAVMGGKLTVTLNTNGDVCAIQKAGGDGVIQSVIMQCLRIASVKAADITNKIKKAVESYNTERALRKIKRHPDPVVDVSKGAGMGVRSLSIEMEKTRLKIEDGKVNRSEDMEIETHSSKKTGCRLGDAKFKSFIGGPSSWDPYSKGINGDELKASLASRAAATSVEKMAVSPSVKTHFTMIDKTPTEMDSTPLLQQTIEAGEQTIKVKTLMDAVKPKHRRKKKTKANHDLS
ncbi:exosome complex component RRP45A-like isoform X1 [Primulina eburnea]|uniref:exosome complex component RRP45A-like isoform X1 n=2 Tax=Primulina eburnea TaxID=1245227 RepID=UPI003C6BF259